MGNDLSCEWKPARIGYRTKCGKEINRKPLNFVFCPFCGKKIEVIEYLNRAPKVKVENGL